MPELFIANVFNLGLFLEPQVACAPIPQQQHAFMTPTELRQWHFDHVGENNFSMSEQKSILNQIYQKIIDFESKLSKSTQVPLRVERVLFHPFNVNVIKSV